MRFLLVFISLCSFPDGSADADQPDRPDVEMQPLVANVARLRSALEYLGHPFPAAFGAELDDAVSGGDSRQLQKVLDGRVLFAVSINPELRVSVARGGGDPLLQQAGYTPVLVKILNAATVTRRLQILSPQSGPAYSGASLPILQRQAQTELNDNENTMRAERFLRTEMFTDSPMTAQLSGFPVEYAIALIYSGVAGQREATIVFDIGQGTQDLGFRSEVPVLFTARPAIPVTVRVRDHDGTPTTARLEIRGSDGRVYPPQANRLAPDFFFQPQIYRADGEEVLLPPGRFSVSSGRGPEYRTVVQEVAVAEDGDNTIKIALERWVHPAQYGFRSGDHHIHAAGCSHYDNPTQGVSPSDMFAQVKGEGLNVGCVLTWGPCFDHQRQYFSPIADTISEPDTVLKYDLEISGFGSAALGHVCLLNLQDQTYPGSDGTSSKGWPTWTVPVMRWAREQGGVTGYPHSALHTDPVLAADWQLTTADSDKDGFLSAAEFSGTLGAQPFETSDVNNDGRLSRNELQRAADTAADMLPNYAIPSLNGGGAMEIFVSTSEGVCDFISAMDTARIPEWNTWYHLMNCGFPLKLSGETDFPCMSSRRVGQGRVYVNTVRQDKVDFEDWCAGIAAGRSYVSDGFAHALNFRVNEEAPGGIVRSAVPTEVTIQATVAFAPEQPRAVAYGTLQPAAGRRMTGDTVNLHAERDTGVIRGGKRLVEIVVNGEVAASRQVEADGTPHSLTFQIPVSQSSWIALRQFPQLHTNPVTVEVAGKPIRAQRRSALWCAECVRRLWHNRSRFISAEERPAAEQAYRRALDRFFDIADECGTGQPVKRFGPEAAL